MVALGGRSIHMVFSSIAMSYQEKNSNKPSCLVGKDMSPCDYFGAESPHMASTVPGATSKNAAAAGCADADATHPRMTLLKCHEDLKQHHQNERTILQELHDTWRNQPTTSRTCVS